MPPRRFWGGLRGGARAPRPQRARARLPVFCAPAAFSDDTHTSPAHTHTRTHTKHKQQHGRRDVPRAQELHQDAQEQEDRRGRAARRHRLHHQDGRREHPGACVCVCAACCGPRARSTQHHSHTPRAHTHTHTHPPNKPPIQWRHWCAAAGCCVCWRAVCCGVLCAPLFFAREPMHPPFTTQTTTNQHTTTKKTNTPNQDVRDG